MQAIGWRHVPGQFEESWRLYGQKYKIKLGAGPADRTPRNTRGHKDRSTNSVERTEAMLFTDMDERNNAEGWPYEDEEDDRNDLIPGFQIRLLPWL